MLISCWSLKGGSGTTVVAAALGSVLGRRHPEGALVVDLVGDVPAVFGQSDEPGRGVAEWLAAGDAVAPDGWGRLEVAVAPHLAVVRRGRGSLPGGERAQVLAGMLAAAGRPVVVDCGVLPPPGCGGRGRVTGGSAAQVLATAATHSWLVTRPCYLALRHCTALPLCPSGVVLVREADRLLRADDIEVMVGAPVVARVPWDATIARAVDQGALARSVPRLLERALRVAA